MNSEITHGEARQNSNTQTILEIGQRANRIEAILYLLSDQFKGGADKLNDSILMAAVDAALDQVSMLNNAADRISIDGQ